MGGENDKKLKYKSVQNKWGKLTKKCNHVTLHDLSLNDIYENIVRSKYHCFKIKLWSYISYNMNVLIAIFQNMLLFIFFKNFQLFDVKTDSQEWIYAKNYFGRVWLPKDITVH